MAGDFAKARDTAPGRGIYCLIAGGPVPVNSWHLPWRDGWALNEPLNITKGQSWHVYSEVFASEFDFPNSDLDVVAELESSKSSGEPIVNADDQRAILTAVYASSMGALVTHQHAPAGLIVGGLAFPEHIVDGVYNFFGACSTVLNTQGRRHNDTISIAPRNFRVTHFLFHPLPFLTSSPLSSTDPDTWQTARAMAYTGNKRLGVEVANVLNTSGRLICQSTTTGDGACTQGQIPHHFAQVCSKNNSPTSYKLLSILCSQQCAVGAMTPTTATARRHPSSAREGNVHRTVHSPLPPKQAQTVSRCREWVWVGGE
jgi:hypothetical protein